MRIYENETQAQLKQRLRKSAEVQHYIYYTFLLVISVLLLFFPMFLRLNAEGAAELFWEIVPVSLAVSFGPVVVFNCYRLATLFHKQEHYSYYQVKLTRLDSSRWLGASRFTVVLEEKDGSKRIVNTHYIFTPKGLTNPSLDDYVGTSAVVGYNEETGQVVFLG